MVRSMFKTLCYIAGICLVGSFILQAFPGTNQIWEAAKQQFSFFYAQSVTNYGVLGSFIIIGIVTFLFFGKK